MPRLPASPPSSGGPSPSARSRAAAPVTDPVVLRLASGPGFLGQLREAVAAAPHAARFLIGQGDAPAEVLASHEPVVAVGLAVRDTCKEVVDGLVRRTVPRERLVDLTGPWLLTRTAVMAALDHVDAGPSPRDPLALCRRAGLRIHVVGGA